MNKFEAIVIIALFALFCEPQSVNKIFDFVVPVYSLTALVIFIVHLKASLSASDDADNEGKDYKWTKNKGVQIYNIHIMNIYLYFILVLILCL